MARHALGAVGHPARIIDAWMVVAVRSHAQRAELVDRIAWGRRNRVAQQSLLGAVFRDPGQCLVWRAVLFDYVPRRA